MPIAQMDAYLERAAYEELDTYNIKVNELKLGESDIVASPCRANGCFSGLV